jgi:FlaA1/EpsC-like NDP-sugar epimerase
MFRELFLAAMKILTLSVLPVLGLPRLVKRILVLFLDFSLCIVTTWFAFFLRFGELTTFTNNESIFFRGFVYAAIASIALALPIFVVSGLYRAIFRYSGWPAVMTIAQAVGVYGLLYAAIFMAIGVTGVPRTIGIIQPILLFLFVGGSRLFARVWLGDQYRSILKKSNRPKVLIYGAGNSGRQLASALVNSHEMQIVGFLDDDVRMHGQVLNRLPIYNTEDLESLIFSQNIHSVLLALPSISRNRRNEILRNIQKLNVLVRTIPTMSDLVHGKVTTNDIRELDIDDLLGRDSVIPKTELLTKNNKEKIVLVTGAGGSIGSELCRQILKQSPSSLILLDQNEFALYQIHQELQNQVTDLNTQCQIVPILTSVNHFELIKMHINQYKPDIIYHAAAYKHVPLVEANPIEGIKNNVLGTLTIAKIAIEAGVQHFILISTDKAVRPTNVMGASKRVAEMILQALATQSSQTCFTMVRFGNVLDSSGSVVPKFRQQIKDGGPVTVTDYRVTRYFMTIPEAAQLVIQAGAIATGGDVFLLDMGEPVKIIDLAHRMIELSGLEVKNSDNPHGDIEIAEIGLRSGEKLYEELLIEGSPDQTIHPRIFKSHEDFMPWEVLQIKLELIHQAIVSNDQIALINLLKELVSGYIPESSSLEINQ